MTTDIVAALIAERDKLNQAIAILQGSGTPKRRGRPPKNPFAAPAARSKARRTMRKRTKAQREAQAERMRKYWAARKKPGA
jgi:hypothetical protein